MTPEKPALVPLMDVTVESGEIMPGCKLAVNVLPPLELNVTLLGPKVLDEPAARLLGLPLMSQVTTSALTPEAAVTEGLLQVTTVLTGTTRVMVALAVPLSAWAIIIKELVSPTTASENNPKGSLRFNIDTPSYYLLDPLTLP
jgi:hypothetical protein